MKLLLLLPVILIGSMMPHAFADYIDVSSYDAYTICSIANGCLVNCYKPTIDPLATNKTGYDVYDSCILDGMHITGMNQTWQGQILKAQIVEESGFLTKIVKNGCGGQNCGVYAISAGKVSGDNPPGPCGVWQIDPYTGLHDYSHSYGLFQSTPACEGVFEIPANTVPCIPTNVTNIIPFNKTIQAYCESKVSQSKHFIDATQNTTSSLYAKSAFSPGNQIFVYFIQWNPDMKISSSKAFGCNIYQYFYLNMAYWLTGNIHQGCAIVQGQGGHSYLVNIIRDFQYTLYGTIWAHPFP